VGAATPTKMNIHPPMAKRRNDVPFHSLYLGRRRYAFWKQLKVTEIGLENLKLLAIHAISRTGDVPLTSGKMYDMSLLLRYVLLARQPFQMAWVVVCVCAVRVVLVLTKQCQFRACVLHSAISGASSY